MTGTTGTGTATGTLANPTGYATPTPPNLCGSGAGVADANATIVANITIANVFKVFILCLTFEIFCNKNQFSNLWLKQFSYGISFIIFEDIVGFCGTHTVRAESTVRLTTTANGKIVILKRRPHRVFIEMRRTDGECCNEYRFSQLMRLMPVECR